MGCHIPLILPLGCEIAYTSSSSSSSSSSAPLPLYHSAVTPLQTSLLQLFNREAQRPDATEHWPEQAGEGGFGVRATTGNEMMSPTRQLTKSASAGGFRSTGGMEQGVTGGGYGSTPSNICPPPPQARP